MRTRILTLTTTLALFGILAFALALRVYDISARPFHSDEGVNFGFLDDITATGHYPYSHANYHGPLFFYLAYAFHALFGDSELSLRSTSIFASVLSLLALLPLASVLSKRFVIIAWLLFTISASHVFHSRYFIHEMLLLAGTGCAAVGVFCWLARNRVASLYYIAVGLIIVVTTKETWIISAAAVGVAALTISQPRGDFNKLLSQRSAVVLALLATYIVSLAVYSACFTWFGGIVQAGLAIPQWLGRGVGDKGHFKPFLYYLRTVIAQTEPWLLLAPICAVGFELRRAVSLGWKGLQTPESITDRALRFFLVWSLLATIVYSAVPYKTPWLVINLTYPLTLLFALLLDKLWGVIPPLGALALAGISVVSLGSTAIYNYSKLPIALAADSPIRPHPYGRENPYSYVHTSQGMRDFIADLQRYWSKVPNARVLIGVNAYWPIPYYLNDNRKQLAYLSTTDLSAWSAAYDVLVAERSVIWFDTAYVMKEYRFSDVEEARVFFLRPEARGLPRCFTFRSLTPVFGAEVIRCW